jgi:hypothetical protein
MTELGKYFETESLGHDQYQTIIGLKPINYHDGSWKRNVLDWIDSGVGERPHIVTAAPFIVSVSPDGDRRIHPTREDDVWFEMSGAKINNAGTWEVIQLGTPTSRIDNRITWNRTNYNAYVDMAGHYVKLAYLLKNGYLPPNNQFAYEVATNGLTRAGGVFSKDGVPVMHMRKPVAYDYDNPEDVRQIAHEIVRIDGKWHVVFTLPDLTGMFKPLIDPTLTLQPDAAAGIDTYVRSDQADTAYGTAAAIYGGNAWVGFIEFDLSPLVGKTITSGTFSGWNASQKFGVVVLNLHAILAANSGWIEECTWNHADGAGASQRWAGDTGNDGGADAGCTVSGTDYYATYIGTHTTDGDVPADEEMQWDLDTAQLTSMVTANYGMKFVPTQSDISIHSSDYTTAALRPKLVVDWTVAGGDGEAGARILNLMPMQRRRRSL